MPHIMGRGKPILGKANGDLSQTKLISEKTKEEIYLDSIKAAFKVSNLTKNATNTFLCFLQDYYLIFIISLLSNNRESKRNSLGRRNPRMILINSPKNQLIPITMFIT